MQAELCERLKEGMEFVVLQAHEHVCKGVRPPSSPFPFPNPTRTFEPTEMSPEPKGGGRSSSSPDRRSPTPPGARMTRSRHGGEGSASRGGASVERGGGRWGRGRGGRGARKPGRGRWPAKAAAAGGGGEDGEGEEEEGRTIGSGTLSGSTAFHDAPKYQTDMDHDKDVVVEEEDKACVGTDVWRLVHAHSEFTPLCLLPDDMAQILDVMAPTAARDADAAARLPAVGEGVLAMEEERDCKEGGRERGGFDGAAAVADSAKSVGVGGGGEEGGEEGGKDSGEGGDKAQTRSAMGETTKVIFGNLNIYVFFR